jgi:dihydrodipicolinate synthase/N-acetylneuraminate lyase
MTLAAVFPPMPTPFKDGEVDATAIASNVTRWVRAGLGGVLALGSNGEAPLLEDEEGDRVVGAARDVIPRDRVLIVGTGRESTRGTIAASRRAAALGADAVLVRAPFFFKAAMTADALVRHYLAVADGSPVGVLLYNFPALTGINLAPETIARLAEHPNIIGVKETSSDAQQLAACVDAVPRSFAVLCGSAPVFYAALCLGAAGGIVAAACVVPELCVELHTLVAAGRHADARALQRRLTPLARLVTAAHGVPGLKAAMELAGYTAGDPRAPLAPLGEPGIQQIRAAIGQLQEVS